MITTCHNVEVFTESQNKAIHTSSFRSRDIINYALVNFRLTSLEHLEGVLESFEVEGSPNCVLHETLHQTGRERRHMEFCLRKIGEKGF